MHTRALDFGVVLKDRLRPLDQPIAQQGVHTRGYSEARKGGTHHTGPAMWWITKANRTVTHVGTTTIRMAGGATCTDNAFDTSSTALSRIFYLIKAVNL
jgi:hypothetical protein